MKQQNGLIIVILITTLKVNYINSKVSRDSSVSIVTGYGLDDQEGREFESQ
jgi:hypothetical protein